MKNEGLMRITLDYALEKCGDDILDQIIKEELTKAEKTEFIGSIGKERIKEILLKIGFCEDFLNTM